MLDVHAHVGDIFPRRLSIQIDQPAPPPHYLMLSSPDIEDAARLLYRHRPLCASLGFLKHAILTLMRRRQTLRGMVAPNLLRDMARYGINASVALPIEYEDGVDRSTAILQACRQFPEVIPFCSVHPKDARWREKLDTYIALGAQGLKIHPNLQRFAFNDRACVDVVAAFAPSRLPIILHSGLTGRERRARRFSDLAGFDALPARFSDTPFILAHAGLAQYEAAMRLAQQHENVWLELSGQPAQHIRRMIAVVGAERLLFGSDWPFWPQRLALQAIRDAADGDEAVARRILHDNAARLLRR